MTSSPALMIEARGVEKWYPNGFHALRGVDLYVHQGEVVVIMGPSGSGKSTFLRTFNAMEDFQKGSIVVDGIEISDDLRRIDAIRREVGMVFQQFNLFPHLTVLDNLTLAPVKVRKRPKAEVERRGACQTPSTSSGEPRKSPDLASTIPGSCRASRPFGKARNTTKYQKISCSSRGILRITSTYNRASLRSSPLLLKEAVPIRVPSTVAPTKPAITTRRVLTKPASMARQ